jgi:6,7-dimethyl-8-ribityllumazine synthase|tara:strand:- start:4602 stop:5003 length:402 start_codon:yes stop_codon:yes gene_type:complete
MKPKVLIITANFYKDICLSLTNGAIIELKKKAKFKKIIVPGIFEIPVVIAKNIRKYDAFIALGCVIKGKTPHFAFISKSVINAITNLSVNYKKPIGNGIITCFNKKQAIERSRNKNNKGREAAKAALSVLKSF